MLNDPQRVIAETVAKYRDYLNPGLAALMRFVGFDTVEWEAEGAVVRDVAGREFIDCLGSYGALVLGHRHPRVVAAVVDQLSRMPLSCKTLFDKPQADLAERLAQVLPGQLRYSFFCNSGAEAVEGALKLARLATGRPHFIAAQGAFHGKTLGALSASGREIYRAPFEPLVPGFSHVPFGDAAAMEAALDERTAAVILEPIQGEAGVVIPPAGYLRAVRDACDRVGALLVLDEVQTGMGRTGTLFACEQEGIVPDLICLAKGLGGGVMPLGACCGTPAVWKALEPNPLLHSSTFGGNPLACRAGLAAFEVIESEGLCARAAALGEQALARLAEMQSAHPDTVQEVRGRGLLIGVQFALDDIAGLVIAGLAQRGVIAAYTLNNPRVIRLEPPLVITDSQLDRALTAFAEAVAETAALVRQLE